MPLTLETLDQIIAGWEESACSQVNVGGLLAKNLVAHKWKATYRSLVIRELTLWRTTDLLRQISVLLNGGHYLGARILTRCVIETLSILIFLNQRIEAVLNGHIDFNNFSDITTKLMLGEKREEASLKVIHILDVLRKAEKRYPGLIDAYDDLSESAHPNRDGILVGYSRSNPEEFETNFENRWQELFGKSQLPLLELCIRIFEFEYNEAWVKNSNKLEAWLEQNDSTLEINKRGN